jgi:hypothetical protein
MSELPDDAAPRRWYTARGLLTCQSGSGKSSLMDAHGGGEALLWRAVGGPVPNHQDDAPAVRVISRPAKGTVPRFVSGLKGWG